MYIIQWYSITEMIWCKYEYTQVGILANVVKMLVSCGVVFVVSFNGRPVLPVTYDYKVWVAVPD